MTAAVSALDDATLTLMRAEARRHRSGFIDPVLARDAQAWLLWIDLGWLRHITGRDVPSWQYLENHELWLAVQAYKIDAAHLRDLERAEQEAAQALNAIQAAASREEAQRAAATWQRLQERLPVPVEVWHNWTARHLDGYEQGADHIVVQAELYVGRFYRTARQPLCWTPSRAHELRHVTANVRDERRLPDCKACLRHAERLAGLQTGHAAARVRDASSRA